MIEIYVSKSYENMSIRCVNDLLESIRNVNAPLICVASGDTPKGLYKELIQKIKQDNIDISGWYFLGLDEWSGMNGDDEGSCRDHLNKDLFNPLNIDKNKIIFFDGRAADQETECKKIEQAITERGGINVGILGLGINGHVGMNEPGTDKMLSSHVAQIAESTNAVGQKYFTSAQKLTHGLTLGIATLMKAKFLMLLANGNKKAEIVQKILHSKITPQLPATLLFNHRLINMYLDKEAASN